MSSEMELRPSVVCKALGRLFMHTIPKMAERELHPLKHNPSRFQIVYNVIDWFIHTPAAYDAIEDYYITSDNPVTVSTFLMFAWLAFTTTGVVGDAKCLRKISAALTQSMKDFARKDHELHTSHDLVNAQVSSKAAKVLVAMEGVPDTGVPNAVLAVPKRELEFKESITSYLVEVLRLMFMEGDRNSSDTLGETLKIFGEYTRGLERGYVVNMVDTDMKFLKDTLLEARTRAFAAESMAEVAEERVTALEKKLATQDKRMAAIEKKLATLTMVTTGTTPDVLSDRIRRLEIDAPKEFDGVNSRLKYLEASWASLASVLDARPPPPPPPPPSQSSLVQKMTSSDTSAIRRTLGGLATVQQEHGKILRKLVAEMEWILPQFRHQFCSQWNSLVTQWHMQQRINSAYVSPAEFTAIPSL